MTNYRQKEIPQIRLIWDEKDLYSLRLKAFEYAKANFAGKTIVNTDLNIPITITVKGLKKTTHGGAMMRAKAELIRILPQLLRVAKYNNFGKRKESDSKDIIGYLNFIAKCRVDDKVKKVRIAVQFQRGGKYHYSFDFSAKTRALPKAP